MGLFGKSDKKLDEKLEEDLSMLFKLLAEEHDPELKKMILDQIQSVEDVVKEQKKKKAKWRIFS
jgi:hypothetical protein